MSNDVNMISSGEGFVIDLTTGEGFKPETEIPYVKSDIENQIESVLNDGDNSKLKEIEEYYKRFKTIDNTSFDELANEAIQEASNDHTLNTNKKSTNVNKSDSVFTELINNSTVDKNGFITIPDFMNTILKK